MILVKHAPGRHDQRTHGIRGGEAALVGLDKDLREHVLTRNLSVTEARSVQSARVPGLVKVAAPDLTADQAARVEHFKTYALTRFDVAAIDEYGKKVGVDDPLAMAVQAFEHDYGDFNSRITEISSIVKVDTYRDQDEENTIEDGLTIKGRLYNSNGRVLGDFTRSFTADGNVQHDWFKFSSDLHQGAGVGVRFFKHSEDVYIANGLKTITAHANLDVGGYAWARVGFDFNESGVYRNKITALAIRSGVRAETLAAELPHAWDVAAYTHNGNNYGRTEMMGSNWYGIKSLDPTSPSYQAGQAYYRAKGL